jgi:RNA polymerase sigma-70 factor (ECF subfamily)
MTNVLSLRSMTLDRAKFEAEPRGRFDDSPERLRSIIDAHYDFLWRSVRRIGTPEGSTEDVVQKVLLVVSRRLSEIKVGSEKSFLYRTALHVASHERRTERRRREDFVDDAMNALESDAPGPLEQLDAAQTRTILDDVLDGLETDLRAVFVLYELEEMNMAAIAAMLDLPAGTVASRLRRARDEFRELAKRARVDSEGAR